MDKVHSILLVCTGNSCRSVMAEGLMKKYLKELGKNDIKIFSAGTGAIDGFPPTEETVEVMRKESVDVSAYRSKHITEYLIKNSDLILVMEAIHKDIVTRVVPGARSKTYLLKEYGADQSPNCPDNLDIHDPIGRPMEYYDLSFEVIKDQILRIVKSL